MKGWCTGLLMMLVLASCNDSASVQIHINDSFENKIDSGAKRLVDSTKENLKKAGDEVEEKAKKLNEKLKVKLKDKKDSN